MVLNLKNFTARSPAWCIQRSFQPPEDKQCLSGVYGYSPLSGTQ
ncbi:MULTISPECIES: hypothetical protein [Cyanophyceae]|nr:MULTISPECIES: hypothetical protein [unclassified Coleofasciculus]